MTQPFIVGEVIPGYCGGQFSMDTYDHDLRVEAVGIDWIVLRDINSDAPVFYSGTHESLRCDVKYTLRDRAERDT